MGRIWELVEELNASPVGAGAELADAGTMPAIVKPPATCHPHDDGGHHTQGGATAPPPGPWPATLDGLGTKKVGSFRPCLWCGAGTWVRYAGLPTCLTCARSWPETRTQDGARAYLWRLLDTWAGMDENLWQEANVKALYEDIMDVFKAHPQADDWFKAWRQAHPEARLT